MRGTDDNPVGRIVLRGSLAEQIRAEIEHGPPSNSRSTTTQQRHFKQRFKRHAFVSHAWLTPGIINERCRRQQGRKDRARGINLNMHVHLTIEQRPASSSRKTMIVVNNA